MLFFRRMSTIAARVKSALVKHELPDLPYDYSALEPILSRDIMMLHHCKHHQAYVTTLNAAEEKLRDAIENNDTNVIISLQPTLRFNGGGHINHSIFWNNLSPLQTEVSEELSKAINDNFESMDDFKKILLETTVAIKGSGWGWLGYDRKRKILQIETCTNQDPLEATTGLLPLLGIDVWEHAYYLQYKNARADYVKNLFDIVNWEEVSKRYAQYSSFAVCN
ncbi:hypothetical protein FQA39_LY01424 [Lamprigera yunnana]|nr:hypothetical protein FQA39_LY01424 [Lamprigera yunnana]